MKYLALLTFSLVLGLQPSLQADWTSFRNGGNSSTEPIPIQWSPESVTWQVELTGYGQSTPVIQGNQVFVASVVGGMKEECLLQCFDLNEGNELWRFQVPSAKQSPSNYMASRAAPTPVVDENAVYVFFETGDLLAVDLSAKRLWHRDLSEEFGAFENNHGLGSSPTQNDSYVFLNLEHKGPSYLVAISKSTGKTEWKAERPSGSSWSSPIYVAEATPQVILSSAGAVTSYSAEDGETLWTVDGLDGNSVPSPTYEQGKLFVGARLPEFAEEGSIRSNCCLDISKATSGPPETLWKADKAISDYASPVVVDEFVYFINKVGVLHCLDVGTGKMHYRKRLSGACWSTPIVSESRIYFFCKDGSTQVIQAGKEFEILSENNLWNPENPPKPEEYVEFTGGPGHGHGHGSHGGAQSQGRKPGGGMIAALMRGDANGDGILEREEISKDFQALLPRVDKNNDGKLDAAELEAMAKSFAERRSGSKTAARDPIVYGVAASNGSLVIRTGTRLYCIRN